MSKAIATANPVLARFVGGTSSKVCQRSTATMEMGAQWAPGKGWKPAQTQGRRAGCEKSVAGGQGTCPAGSVQETGGM